MEIRKRTIDELRKAVGKSPGSFPGGVVPGLLLIAEMLLYILEELRIFNEKESK